MRHKTDIERAGERRLAELGQLASEIAEMTDADAEAAREAAARHLAEHVALCESAASIGAQAWH